MKKTVCLLLTALLGLMLTGTIQAMEGMNHGAAPSGDQNGMAMGGEMLSLGSDVKDGVTAQAHLSDIAAAMAKLGMDKTHHFMVMLTDASGKQIDNGLVAVKIVDPSGKKHDAIKLMAMDGSFGADVALSQKGKYLFEVGTKLGETKRQFQFQHMVH